ncbi:DUF5606 domain-containing protein [Phaeodactylibacter sp.]|jgi:hypothetical protein|uniref:DUF5606 family protein n=1 Tax=Phaeodactylibacter sp. TaxID=1940289 RepID=UPI0025D22707|nr:DUF5606 domain-containing protein [Phaeodactylibacter sp.]MCI4647186.1 DUF5606 domain-containing protein [Phaeodactylibacter sp.]MCI5093354.1 DUF5606 domain-containing protein [Phaeodactylibacter sp.]
MNLEQLIAVSGLSGIYRMAANRSNGLIIEDVQSGKRRFASSRKHQFTPLESISIFTDDGDSMELKKVFRNMKQQQEDNPPPAASAKSEELHEYFAEVLPTYDRDRVFNGDIKKVIKWFNYLDEAGMLSDSAESDEEE